MSSCAKSCHHDIDSVNNVDDVNDVIKEVNNGDDINDVIDKNDVLLCKSSDPILDATWRCKELL